MDRLLSREEFLDLKRDYSPFLVHLTKAAPDGTSAKDILAKILKERELKAFNAWCLFNSEFATTSPDFVEDFKVVCFTETPIDQISLLLRPVSGRGNQPEPYGIIFDKQFMRSKGGNSVFYVGDTLMPILWDTYKRAKDNGFSEGESKFLALVNRCDEDIDFHWEREWRIVGNLSFNLDDVYLGLCPEAEIAHFEQKFPPVRFICPNWGFTKTLRKLLEQSPDRTK